MPKGMYVVFTNCKDPKRHEEYNRWYSRTHIGDLTKAKGSTGATRYLNVQPAPGQGQYLVLYPFDHPDLLSCVGDLGRLASQTFVDGRHIDCLEAVGLHLFRELKAEDYPPLKDVNYPAQPSPITPTSHKLSPVVPGIPLNNRMVRLVFSTCSDPKRDEEFNSWHFHTHIPDLKSKGLVRSTRWKNVLPKSKETPFLRIVSEYISIYEFEGKPTVEDSLQDFLGAAHKTFGGGRIIDCLERNGSANFQEIDGNSIKPLEKLAYPQRATSGPVALREQQAAQARAQN